MNVLGIDIGGSSIKAAVVNTSATSVDEVIVTKLLTVPTQAPASPQSLGEQIEAICQHFNWHQQPIGLAFPGVILEGRVKTAANIDKSWLDFPGQSWFAKYSNCPVTLLNDADAAGIAEMRFGAGQSFSSDSTTLMLTLGTGIGSALFIGEKLYPNTELGHIIIDGREGEHFAAASVKARENLDWQEWCRRLNLYISYVESLLWPNQMILGGAISAEFDIFAHLLNCRAKVVPAMLGNNAGLIGAACFGH